EKVVGIVTGKPEDDFGAGSGGEPGRRELGLVLASLLRLHVHDVAAAVLVAPADAKVVMVRFVVERGEAGGHAGGFGQMQRRLRGEPVVLQSSSDEAWVLSPAHRFGTRREEERIVLQR